MIRREERLRIPHLELTHDLLIDVVQKSKTHRHQRQRQESEREKQRQEMKDRELRRSRRLMGFIGAAALIFLALFIWSLVSFDREQAARAEANRVKTEAAERLRDLAILETMNVRQAQKKADASARARIEPPLLSKTDPGHQY